MRRRRSFKFLAERESGREKRIARSTGRDWETDTRTRAHA